MKDKTKKIKIVVVGDSRVGKTTLINRYAKDVYIQHFIPIILYNQDVHITDGQEVYEATLVDTCGDEDYNRIRPIVYIEPKPDVVLVCFAVDNRLSYENIISAWLPEVKHYLPKAPRILVGTKSDLEAEITSQGGQELKETIKASCYVECSSKEGTGVKAAFDAAATAYTRKQKKARCPIL